MKKRTFFTYSFGCRVNQAEKEVIDREMQYGGFSLENRLPYISIINTCAITQKAEREAKQLIYSLKRENPEGRVVITGCSATYWKKNDLLKDLPVDLVVDNIHKEFLVKLLKKRLLYQPTSNLGGQNKLGWVRDKYLKSGRALIKIQDGCQRFCTYCIVPYLRGTPKSFRIKEIVSQIRHYPDLKEIILTAINTEAFGRDTGESIIKLIETVLTDLSISRISFGSIHPWSINDEFLKYYKRILPLKRLINFFHVPIQSGSDKILNLMKRGYNRKEMLEKLQRLQKINPQALIATDVIVGFLDESDDDFNETYNFLKLSPISKFHIFRFSSRDNTAAHYMSRNLKEPLAKVKIQRARMLAELGKKKYEDFLKINVGRNSQALFISNRVGAYQEALLDNQLPVLIKTSRDLSGQLRNINILEYKKGMLFGEIN
jgi:threonylcarbamoyladenosine tRNA methylthiotransferase MtaB